MIADPSNLGNFMIADTVRWKPVINAFAITFSDRWPAAESY